ncbi:MAG: hypothetical protein COW01_07560 [Bdellovibrionales bacterium CG12_big_fil_rev_8_21_14_0_65_38_15]|nr:MAG: hypothetical protein COW79_01500 [Bdellovibrionales bacterium CG22_combo_CG10-13_8_21_14_all_38_13]PIQ55226.1 MAG: hypothetical protein COW01_07560 [Bdellovibrionales bacterium CG12_big_fil_rev_8_21_14_0_65_38_15]PIR30526.1 MAG: hypothetical protein COV38_05090 [Bdellovibrionales bacterium CG11_big_fil_rev_8_21_14_0_20_38_13]
MKLYLIVFSILIYSINANSEEKKYTLKEYEKTPKTLSQVNRLAIKLQREMLVSKLHEILMAGRPSRFFGSAGNKKVKDKIIEMIDSSSPSNKATLELFDIKTDEIKKSYSADFDKYLASGVSPGSEEAANMRLFTESMLNVLDKAKEIKGENIIWEKKGYLQPDEVLIIGVNYDTIAQDPKKFIVSGDGEMPGADNNATGVAAALSLIEVASQVSIGKTLRVIFFDGEELGQSGSKAYVEAHQEELSKLKVAGFINLLMLGHDTVDKDLSKKSGNFRAYTRTSDENEKGATIDLVLANYISKVANKVRSSVEFTPTPRKDLFSSQKAFTDAQIPSVILTHDWENDFNTDHHTKQDFAETLNFSTFHNATQAIIGSVLAWSFDMR